MIALGADQLGVIGALKLNGSYFIIAVVLGALLGVPRLRVALWIAATAVVVVILIISYTPVTAALTAPLVRRDSLPVEKLDAVVVLSGGMTSDGAMGPQTVDRLLKGLEVAAAGKASALLVSRETRTGRGGALTDSVDEAHVMGLAAITVPIYFIDSATSTRDEAVRTRASAAARNWSRIGVITSPFHSRRACATFESVGFKVTCIPSESRDHAVRNLQSTGDRVQAFQGWVYEFAGTTKYRLKGWIT